MDLLRQIVAGPRARHPEAGLDLCYVTHNIIATSGPSGTYPQVAYRNPLKDLVKFLDAKHADQWAIWEFRAEGTGYPDEEVYNRIRHYPWPDHHPPPFALVPLIMGSMRQWLKDDTAKGRVAVVHCKAGKGRSGTISCSYLISEENWTPKDAMQRFTDRRMRPNFGNGITIPSQLRWITYVDRWAKHGKRYVERPVEIVEVHVWGLRDGVKIAIEGYVDEGKVIKTFHTFKKEERKIVRGEIRKDTGFADVAMEMMGKKKTEQTADAGKQIKEAEKAEEKVAERRPSHDDRDGGDVVFTPSSRVVLPSSDVNIDFERRNKSKYGGFTMVTSVAHVWFNTFFEGNGPEQKGISDDSGVFSIDFDAMDGIKGSSRKGTKSFDRLQVVWRAIEKAPSVKVDEPSESTEHIPQARPADWKQDEKSEDFERKLGLRQATSDSADVSRASSMRTERNSDKEDVKDELDTVKSTGPDGTQLTEGFNHDRPPTGTKLGTLIPSKSAPTKDASKEDLASQKDGTSEAPSSCTTLASTEANSSQADLEGSKHHDHTIGHMKLSKNTTTSS
ncbi:hypothetical protein AC578_5931 [Pseudocercospora eumusae]|uniref:phosphatidylinositol-3,4,5-trisphosphate 3-phosphatase n=1 Tax=Pseudocercospora eumusae TaxID=321146 RepID=A0A139HIA3_9PEZI|nr:hypothetical protein AC578_5931 [Pseudocercospora eumusae]